MNNSTVFNNVMREYEKDRSIAARKKNERIEELYWRIPELKQIENEISQLFIDISKKILADSTSDNSDYSQSLRERIESLNAEKNKLIAEKGYPPDYTEGVYKCMKCKDSGYADNARCDCLKQRLIDEYIKKSNIHESIKYENFDYFDIRYYSDKKDNESGLIPKRNIQMIYNHCLDFVKNFDVEYENLLFYGKTGLGKTFLCGCIAKEILNKGNTVLYTTAPQLAKTVERVRFDREHGDAEDELLKTVYDVSLLIIDDLGSEISTIVTMSELFGVLNSRLLNRRPTIISSNLTPDELSAAYSDRIFSRMVGGYLMLKFVGQDIREKKKYLES